MIRDTCLLCARNKTRRWAERHVPQVTGGMADAGLAVVIATWPDQGTAGWVSFFTGYIAVLSGGLGMIAWRFGWRPSLKRLGRRAWRTLRGVLAISARTRRCPGRPPGRKGCTTAPPGRPGARPGHGQMKRRRAHGR